MDLIGHLRSIGPMALAFSGGTDSTYLLSMVLRSGVDVTPYIADTPFNKSRVVPDAVDLCRSMGVEPVVVPVDMLSFPEVVVNGSDRCYHCKRHLFTMLAQAAAQDGHAIMVDGTNASDDADERPGMRALSESGVLSPLRDCGICKDEVRRHSKELGLPTWDMPSDSCLATRVITGNLISDGVLGRVEEAESRLADMGFHGCRARTDGAVCRVEFRSGDRGRVEVGQDAIASRLSDLFDNILMSDTWR